MQTLENIIADYRDARHLEATLTDEATRQGASDSEFRRLSKQAGDQAVLADRKMSAALARIRQLPAAKQSYWLRMLDAL